STPPRLAPVKETMSMAGWLDSAAPTPGPSPKTRLYTPAGTPAASMISVKIWAEYGATSYGSSTIVQPVANAGYTLTAIWLIGQFHGVMRPHTPIGSLTTSVEPCCSSNSYFFSTSIPLTRSPKP